MKRAYLAFSEGVPYVPKPAAPAEAQNPASVAAAAPAAAAAAPADPAAAAAATAGAAVAPGGAGASDGGSGGAGEKGKPFGGSYADCLAARKALWGQKRKSRFAKDALALKAAGLNADGYMEQPSKAKNQSI